MRDRSIWKRIFQARTVAKDPLHFFLYISVDPVVLIADLAGSNRDLAAQVAFTSAQVGGFIVGWMWFFLAKFLIQKSGQGSHPYWWLVILFGMSVTLVTDQVVGAIRFGPEALFRLHGSMVLVSVIGGLLAIGVALLLGAAAKYEQLRESIIAERARKAQHRQESLPQVQEFISQARKTLSRSREADPKEIAREIRELVDGQLRPISNSLWQAEAKKLRRFSFGLLARQVLSQPIRLAYVPAGFAVLIANGFFVTELGLFEGWVRLSLMFGVIWLVPALHAELHSRFEAVRKLGLASFPVSVLLSASAAFVFPVLTLGMPDRLRPISYFVTSIFVIGLPAVVSSVSRATGELLRAQRETLREETGREADAEVDLVLAATKARDTANYLHSTTQNRLLAAAMLLESASNKKAVASQLEAVEQTLNDLLQERVSDESLLQQIEALKRNWRGMLKIDFEFGCTHELSSLTEELLVLCVREAVSNAFRHGHANQVLIEILETGGGLELRVTDNGIGPRSPREGMGSRLFDSAGKWSLDALETGGTQLSIQLR